MNVNDIELKAQMQADVANTLDQIEMQCNVNRKTARLILQISTEGILLTAKAIIEAGAEKGPFAMLRTAQERKIGAEAAINLLQDETL